MTAERWWQRKALHRRMSDAPDPPSKADLRASALAARDALSSEARAAAALAIAARGLPVAIAPGTIVSAYSPIRSEIDPAFLMRALASQLKHGCF